MRATFGILFFILKICNAEFECYYTDRTLTCQSCCEYGCCENGSGLSGGAIAGIVIGGVIVLVLKCFYFWYRVKKYQQLKKLSRTVVTVPRSVVVTNTHHVGYNQTRIPTIHQPSPYQRVHHTNPHHAGYDQQVPNFEPVPPPPPYESVAEESKK